MERSRDLEEELLAGRSNQRGRGPTRILMTFGYYPRAAASLRFHQKGKELDKEV